MSGCTAAIRSKSDSLGHLAQGNALGEPGAAGDLVHRRDHDRLLVLGNEAGRTQPPREIRRPVVPVQLPLEALAALGEHAHLARDQVVEVGTLEPTEVAIDDEAASSQAEEAEERPVPLGASSTRQPVGHVVAKLRVVGGQQLGHVGHGRTLILEALGRFSLLFECRWTPPASDVIDVYSATAIASFPAVWVLASDCSACACLVERICLLDVDAQGTRFQKLREALEIRRRPGCHEVRPAGPLARGTER